MPVLDPTCAASHQGENNRVTARRLPVGRDCWSHVRTTKPSMCSEDRLGPQCKALLRWRRVEGELVDTCAGGGGGWEVCVAVRRVCLYLRLGAYFGTVKQNTSKR